MDKDLIYKYNEVVANNDTVYFLGDVSLKKRDTVESVMSKLKGDKHLILGNHDLLKPFTYVELGFSTVHTYLEITCDGIHLCLTHDPAISQINRAKTFLCGHIHDLFTIHRNCINVGVDVWGYRPVSFTQIKEIGAL